MRLEKIDPMNFPSDTSCYMQTRRKIIGRRIAKQILGCALTISVSLIAGCGSSLSSSSSFAFGVCGSDGLAIQDLAGRCRTTPTTIGALEAVS